MTRIIAHLDMDAFFAAVEEREKPYLRDLPVVVGADPQGGLGRGVVSTANYAARAYGIKSATPISRAWEMSERARKEGKPACAFITPRHGKYGDASREVFAIIGQYSPMIEQVSIDEAYLDFSHYRTFNAAKGAAQRMRTEVRRKTKLTASVGVGPNKLIAKIASDANKPNGLTVVLPRQAEDFLAIQSLAVISGIGKKAVEKFARRGMKTVADAKALTWEEMADMFGKWGFGLYERLRAIDERSLVAEEERKSIGRHHTFAEDTLSMEAVFAVLREQEGKIIRDMKRRGFVGFRTVVLTVRFADFETKTRSLTIAESLAGERELDTKAVKLALPFFDSRENKEKRAIRLIGLRIEKLV